MRVHWAVIGFGALIICAGCLGSPASPADTNSSSTIQGPSNLTVAEISYGPDMDHADDVGVGDTPKPDVTSNESHAVIEGAIFGTGDSKCIDISGTVIENSTDSPTVVIQSNTSPPRGEGCNATAFKWPYRATLTFDDQPPQTIHVQHVSDGEQLNAWTIAVNRRDRLISLF